MRKNAPLVSIVMPAYNAERYISESIDSVLRQDYDNYEFIILNDGSSDDTLSIIEKYAKIDTRIKVINQKNMGLVNTLNKAIAIAKGIYIARIDADDPWMDGKLSKQIDLLESDQSLVIVGGGFEVIDENGLYIETVFTPVYDEDIRRTLMVRNPFGHAGVVIKKQAVVDAGMYSDEYGPTEDYDLWIKLLEIGKAYNIPDPIYRYRVNMSGISQQNSDIQMIETDKHQDKLWRKSPPRVLSRNELIKKCSKYLMIGPTSGHGVALKNQLLLDNAQIGIKFFRYRYIGAGIRQTVNVLSTGRTGIRAVIKRFKYIGIGSLKRAARE